MKFYWFGARIQNNDIEEIEDNGFDGVLFTYDNQQGDFFTKIARSFDEKRKIKYMVAIRPYTISPQYLRLIAQTMHTMMPNRLQLNIISGHIKEHEEILGGIVGPVNDKSSNIDRSNYLIEFLYEFDKMKDSKPNILMPDYYVSVTNKYVFDTAKKLKNKIIIPYKQYIHGDKIGESKYSVYNSDNPKTMISCGPILRQTQEELDSVVFEENLTSDANYFTYDDFEKWIKEIKQNGIEELLLVAWPVEEKEHIVDFVKKYKQKELTRT